jgi:broad specificity phosphatase PhoE
MDLVFVRHGEGEHTLDLPHSLSREHPRLTTVGRAQVAELRALLALTRNDLLVVSPTRRTIETAALLAEDAGTLQFVSPAVGPRMFEPHPRWTTLPCDRTLSREAIALEYPGLTVLSNEDDALWVDGINVVPQERFEFVARSLVAWCREQATGRALLVSHDGTIHHYRRLLGEGGLTRASALGDAGWHPCHV